jgi:Domain of unknown function (DUF6306)
MTDRKSTRVMAVLKTRTARPYSSPACFAQEAEAVYLGYMSDGELIELLNTLLESERAGNKVAQAFLAESPSAEATRILEAVRRDKARFAAMLARLIRKLGGTSSPRIGAFYDKAMTIEDMVARLTLLNRDQGCVARKLQEVLPRIRDDLIHGALKAMLEAHEANIARCEVLTTSLR